MNMDRELKKDCRNINSALSALQRTEYPQIPPRVEYSLTEKGYSLLPVLLAMSRWGALHSL